MKTLIPLTCLIIGFFSASSAQAETLFSSPETRLNLIELYTSEGCSSCPPADAWFSGLKSAPTLWMHFVPLAFHVDYWNDLGWRDRYSSARFSERQRRYKKEGALGVVYTPGVVANGHEWRNFGWNAPPTEPGPKVGVLSASLSEDRLEVRFTPAQADFDGSLTLNVALLGAELTSQVKAGENRGRELEHDFVVLRWETLAMKHSDGGYRLQTRLPHGKINAPRHALALWVTPKGSQQPLQATGGWLD